MPDLGMLQTTVIICEAVFFMSTTACAMSEDHSSGILLACLACWLATDVEFLVHTMDRCFENDLLCKFL